MGSNHFYQQQSSRVAPGDAEDEVKSSEESKGTAASFNACSMDAIKNISRSCYRILAKDFALEYFYNSLHIV